jgi:hypothetical protein
MLSEVTTIDAFFELLLKLQHWSDLELFEVLSEIETNGDPRGARRPLPPHSRVAI